jgi:hypothetical protein
MASYVCPQSTNVKQSKMEMGDAPCAEMDSEKPIHCTEFHAGAQLALEHLANVPPLAVITVSFVIPSPPIQAHVVLVPQWTGSRSELGADPPYISTRRLRI